MSLFQTFYKHYTALCLVTCAFLRYNSIMHRFYIARRQFRRR